MRRTARRVLAAGALTAAFAAPSACGHTAIPTPAPAAPPAGPVKPAPSAPATGTAVTALDQLLAGASDFGTGWAQAAQNSSDGPLIAHCAATPAGDVTAQASRSFTGGGQTVTETLSRYQDGPVRALGTFADTPRTCAQVTAAGATYTAAQVPPFAGFQSVGLHLQGNSGERVVYAGVVGDVLAVASVTSSTAHGADLDTAAAAQFRIVVARASGHTPGPATPSAGPDAAGTHSGDGSGGSGSGSPAPGGVLGADNQGTPSDILGTNNNVESGGAGDSGPTNQVGPGGADNGP